MIVGLGLDIAEISRIARIWEKFGMRFARKVLHADELARLAEMGGGTVQFLASRFAAKEAAVKALGTGFSDGILPTDIAVVTLLGGRPELRFHNGAHERLAEMGTPRALVSLPQGKGTVADVVVLVQCGLIPPAEEKPVPNLAPARRKKAP